MPNGSLKYVHVVGHALKEDESGTPEFVGAITDITGRKHAEEILRRSEAYLSEAQRLSHTGSWACIPATGEHTYWSEEAFRVLGFDPAGGRRDLKNSSGASIPMTGPELQNTSRQQFVKGQIST